MLKTLEFPLQTRKVKMNFESCHSVRFLVKIIYLKLLIHIKLSTEVDRGSTILTSRSQSDTHLCDSTENPTGFSNNYYRKLDFDITKRGFLTATIYLGDGRINFRLTCDTGHKFNFDDWTMCVFYNDFFFHKIENLKYFYDCPIEEGVPM